MCVCACACARTHSLMLNSSLDVNLCESFKPPGFFLVSFSLLLAPQIFNLKFTAKQLSRSAVKCEKEEKSERLKVKKAIEKGNFDGAKIYAQNAIRKKSEQLNYMKLSSRLDAVVSR